MGKHGGVFLFKLVTLSIKLSNHFRNMTHPNIAHMAAAMCKCAGFSRRRETTQHQNAEKPVCVLYKLIRNLMREV